MECFVEQTNEDVKAVDYRYIDWGNEPYIEGLYSYPGEGVDKDARLILGQPIENKIFFCGEAFHVTCPSCLHSAMETGIQVAQTLKGYL